MVLNHSRGWPLLLFFGLLAVTLTYLFVNSVFLPPELIWGETFLPEKEAERLREKYEATPYPFKSVLLVGFKFSSSKTINDHDWTLGLPRYVAQHVAQVHVIHVSADKTHMKVGSVTKEGTKSLELSDFLEMIEKEPVDLLMFRQVTLVKVIRSLGGGAIYYNHRFATLIPIIPANKKNWGMEDVEERYPWFKIFIPDMAFLKPPHPPSMWPAKEEVAPAVPKKVLVFVGSLIERKGQVDFAKAVPANYPARILFLGDLRDSKVIETTSKLLDKKNIDHEYLGLVRWEQLQENYKKADGLILFSLSDPSPRVVFEGLIHNLPFLIASTVDLPPILLDPKRNLGVVCDLKKDSPQTLESKMLDFLNADHGYDPFNFAQRYLSEDSVYGVLLQQIAERYRERPALQSISYTPRLPAH